MPEVKTDFGDGSSMFSGMRVIENGCMGSLTQFFPLQPLSCKLFVTGVAYTHVNNPFVAAGFILPAGVTAYLDSGPSLDVFALSSVQDIVYLSSAVG